MTSFELYRLAEGLNASPVELYRRHCTIAETSLNARKHMYIRTSGGRCPFLVGRLCGVHQRRPFACRAYPMRAPESSAGDMKQFVRQKYPALEGTCSLFRLADGDLLVGDMALLTDQVIAYAVDEIYFNMIATWSIDPAVAADPVDLSIPARVTSAFLSDAGVREEVVEYLKSSGQSPMVRSIGQIALALQATAWGAPITYVRAPSRVTLEHATTPGNYVLAATDRASVDAVRALVRSPTLYCKAFSMASAPGRTLISAVYAVPEGGAAAQGGAAVGFQLALEDASLREMTWEGKTPLYVFFVPEDGGTEQAVGLTLNVDQL